MVKEAFYRPDKNEYFNEWEFVDKVRDDTGFIPQLCLVATINEEIVGYIMLSKALIGKHAGLSLGPLAVKPSYQRKGIGKRLIDYGLNQAKDIGYEWIVLTGGDYYYQLGFEPALKYGIKLSDNHPENPYLKIKFLYNNKQVPGIVKYCDSFYDENGELL
ncbi:GNAT family N-acetyltransferase [Tepidimicrobium xylanilyticum]|uniref:GNAT family N-acetyltransferase n=1 Tax=Tepidimicrobium xylanilyticum TaxID=1123352 RepID=UPI00295E332B|nr:N-acetyltransferase [Tepidimicrobium xylanilyticum]